MNDITLIGNICNDLSCDRDIIIRKYAIPLLNYLIENVPYSFKLENLSQIFKNSLGDVLNNMTDQQISSIIQENKFIRYTIDEFKQNDWQHFNNYAKCDICHLWELLETCEGKHHEECEYVEISSKDGCGIKMCGECVHLDCYIDSNNHCDDVNCEIIRCEDCAF